LKTVAYGMPIAAIFRKNFNLGVFHRAKTLAECGACSILRAIIHNNNV
jgi:aerobic-type carbon monoxide dehydrogenase small subunit (CoxS/CutS family)